VPTFLAIILYAKILSFFEKPSVSIDKTINIGLFTKGVPKLNCKKH